MPNLANIDKAIRIMKRAERKHSVNMCEWQSTKEGNFVYNIENSAKQTTGQLHRCGNTACFAGHIAISPEFRRDGGYADPKSGFPIFGKYEFEDAIAEWLNIDMGLAKSFIFGDKQGYGDNFSTFYEKTWSDVNASDVLQKLYELRELALTSEES